MDAMGVLKKDIYARRHSMLHEKYEDFDQEYTSTIFKARRSLLESIESNTLLPENQLNARSLLNSSQLNVVQNIRKKRIEPVLSRFLPD